MQTPATEIDRLLRKAIQEKRLIESYLKRSRECSSRTIMASIKESSSCSGFRSAGGVVNRFLTGAGHW